MHNNTQAITKGFADKIVRILHGVTDSNVNVMGPGGVIIASVQRDRVGSIHEGARRIMAGEVDEVAVTEEMAAKMEGTKAGYNGVLEFDGQRIGCIGITGDPEKVKPLQRLAAIILEEDLAKVSMKDERRDIMNHLADEIEGIADQIRVLAINGSIQAAKIGELGAPFKVVVSEMSKLTSDISMTLNRIRLAAGQIDSREQEE